jgi:hypothetical protein
MKKIILVLTVIGMVTLSSCSNNDPDNDTISEVWEFTNVNFQPNTFSVVLNFPKTIFTSDMVLVYRLTGSTNQGNDIWKLMPESYFFDDGTLDYRFVNDFTTVDAEVRLEGFDLIGLPANVRLNQIFRVVAIPGFFGNKSVQQVDFSDYNATIKAFNIDQSKIKSFKVGK